MAAEGRFFTRRRFIAYWIMASVAGLAGIDAFLVEPTWVEVTRHKVVSDKLKAPLRIVHLSDLHLDADTRLDYVPDMVNSLEPDIVAITGDYCNFIKNSGRNNKMKVRARNFIDRLKPENGVFCCFGNWDKGIEDDLLKGININMLREGTMGIEAGGSGITLTGSEFSWDYDYASKACLQQLSEVAPDTFNILLYHSPDLVEDVACLGIVDLYLCGHTHGGQVRVPFLDALKYGFRRPFPYPGSIVTFSRHGSKYDAGMFRVGGTSIYVNRGLGMEGSAPQVRFFCRPEIAVIDVVPGPESKHALD